MKCPRPGRSSTARRTWFHIAGSACHSSINLGEAPASNNAGSTAMVSLTRGSASMSTSLAAACRAVVVFPQTLGPSMTTEPEEASRRANSGRLFGAGRLPALCSEDS